MIRRIYKQHQNGLFYDTGTGVKANGKTCKVKRQTTRGVDISELKQGTVIIKNSNMKNLKTAQSSAPAIGFNEGVYGDMRSHRMETGGVAMQRRTVEITITNAHASNSEEVIIGDPHSLGALKLGKSFPYAPSADITITGTYGANTRAMLADLPKSTNLRCHGFNIQSFTSAGVANSAFFSNSSFRVLEADYANQSLKDEAVPLQDLVKGNTFQLVLRDDASWRFTFSPNTGLVFNMPPATKITFTTTLVSVGEAKGQVRV